MAFEIGHKCTKHIQYRQSANTKRHPPGNFVRLPRSGEINWQPPHTRRRNAFQAQCISDSIEFDGEALHNAFDTSHIHFSVVFNAKSTFCQNQVPVPWWQKSLWTRFFLKLFQSQSLHILYTESRILINQDLSHSRKRSKSSHCSRCCINWSHMKVNPNLMNENWGRRSTFDLWNTSTARHRQKWWQCEKELGARAKWGKKSR